MLVTFVGAPILVIADADPRAFYFISCALIFVVCMSLLVFIFGPKVVMIREGKGRSNKSVIQRTLGNIKRGDNPTNNSGLSDPSINSSAPTGINDSGTSSLTEGAKVLNHPALEKERMAELRDLKKEKKRLKHLIDEMDRKRIRGSTLSNPEKTALLEELEEGAEGEAADSKKEPLTVMERLQKQLLDNAHDMELMREDKQQLEEQLAQKQLLLAAKEGSGDVNNLQEKAEKQRVPDKLEENEILKRVMHLEQQLQQKDQQLKQKDKELEEERSRHHLRIRELEETLCNEQS